MSASKKITLQELIEEHPWGLRIPEIQRDYVMGSGGKQLEKLLNAIAEASKNNKDFDFSCIITYCSDKTKAPLEIYDGQQRLTTLIILTMLKGKKFGIKCPLNFSYREDANNLLNKLNDDGAKISIEEIHSYICSFSTFSMVNLIEKAEIIKDVQLDYLLTRVKFDMVSIGCQNEIEQFFMDLNSGVKLKEYELYKAKLIHYIGMFNREIYSEKNKNALYLFPFKMDNEWLDFFRIFANFPHPAEEYEIAFIRYCITMICREKNITMLKDSLDYISVEIISQLFDIMENVTKLHIRKPETDLNEADILLFSWGDLKEKDTVLKCDHDKRAAYWNLEFEDYDRQFIFVIQKCLLDKIKQKEMQKDAVLWCYIASLEQRIDVQKEYLRLIKLLLNNNVFYHARAWYECQGKGQYLYDCRYIVYGIPQYYGKHLDEKDEKLSRFLSGTDDAAKHHDAMIQFNKWVTENLPALNLLNKRKIAVSLHEILLGFENKKIKDIVDMRLNILCNISDYEAYLEIENSCIGILKCIDEFMKNGLLKHDDITNDLEKTRYLCKVKLDWPVRSNIQNDPLLCYVMVKCQQDKLYDKTYLADSSLLLNENDPRLVKARSDEEKAFWCFENNRYIPYKLMDRTTKDAVTYNKNGSSSDWRKKWCAVDRSNSSVG